MTTSSDTPAVNFAKFPIRGLSCTRLLSPSSCPASPDNRTVLST